MKTRTAILAVLLVSLVAYGQNPLAQRMQRLNANDALAAEQERARANREILQLTDLWGPVGPWWVDQSWQKCTNSYLKLKVAKERNSEELRLLRQILAGTSTSGTTNAVQAARADQLAGYITNQTKAMQDSFNQRKAIEAKYKLRELKPQTK